MAPTIKRLGRVILFIRRIRINEKLVIFSFFLVFSAVIWYLNKLSSDYIIDLKLPLKVAYTDVDKVLVNEGEQALKMQVKTKGYSILRFKLISSLNPVQLDLSSYSMQQYRGSSSRYFLLTSSLKSAVALQLPAGFRIENIGPDTLFFSFSTIYSKVVPVVPQSKLSFEPQFMQIGHIAIQPDSIRISGPESVIRKTMAVHTAPIVAEGLKESFSGTVPLQFGPNVVAQLREAKFNIEVAKYTEAKLRLPIIVDEQDAANILIIPSVAEVTYRVALKDFSKVQPQLFRLKVSSANDLAKLAKVEIDTFPTFVSKVRVNPAYVEIFKQKK